ncbi:MAG: hypothetical protein PGN34_25820 [Methylobacterium frigidaeris]
MSLRLIGMAAGLVIVAASFTAPANAGGNHRAVSLNDAPANWAGMTRNSRKAHRQRKPRDGAGSASSSAPNGRGTGMGPTGQPSGVK